MPVVVGKALTFSVGGSGAGLGTGDSSAMTCILYTSTVAQGLSRERGRPQFHCAIEFQKPGIEAMPLRDHFHSPVNDHHSWEGFHAAWPTMLVIRLAARLPVGYSTEPRVRLGKYYELDVGALEDDSIEAPPSDSGGVATLPYALPKPTFTIDADIGEEYEYEVLVFDQTRN